MTNRLYELCLNKYNCGKRLIAPLLGSPGVILVNSTIKLAQQNYGEHFKAIKKIVELFNPDIIFPLMDLSVEANALGRFTIFPKDEAPTIPKDKFNLKEIERYKQINIAYDSRLNNYIKTVELMCISFPKNILKAAYVTGPYSLAALIMGADDAAIATINDSEVLSKLCEFTTEKIQEYIRLLIAKDIDIICFLEPTAVMLGPNEFETFSSNYIRYIINSCRYTNTVFLYHTCGNTMHVIDNMVKSGIHGLSLDSKESGIDIQKVITKIPENVIALGNINPTATLLNGTPNQLEKEIIELLEKLDDYPNFILSTGCDVPKETPIDNIKKYFEVSRKYQLKRNFIK